jgi:hypothetical protein
VHLGTLWSYHVDDATMIKREGVTYTLHHIGIPTEVPMPDERFSSKVGMYTTDDLTGPVPIQWHRFEADSPLHPLMRTQPHLAYKVDNLCAAIDGHAVILGPYEPIDNYRVAVVDHDGLPVEFIETSLTDGEIWSRARTGKKSFLYRPLEIGNSLLNGTPTVAVGTRITPRPPHRSARAALPHTAPALSHDAKR